MAKCDCPCGEGIFTHQTMMLQSMYIVVKGQITTSYDVLMKLQDLVISGDVTQHNLIYSLAEEG